MPLNQLPLTLTLRLGANPRPTYPNLTTDASGFFTVSVTHAAGRRLHLVGQGADLPGDAAAR